MGGSTENWFEVGHNCRSILPIAVKVCTKQKGDMTAQTKKKMTEKEANVPKFQGTEVLSGRSTVAH